MNLNTCYPAKVLEFDAIRQLAKVELSIESYYKSLSTFDKEYETLPNLILTGVPVHFPFGSGYCITMPVKAGDQCLVMFAQQGIEHWLYHGRQQAVTPDDKPRPTAMHRRKNSISDALCFVGFNPIPQAIQDFNSDHMVIRNPENNTSITITEDSILVDVEADVIANVRGNVQATVEGNAQVDVSGSTTIKSPTITLDGAVTVTGAMTCQAAVACQAGVSASGTIESTGGDVKAGNISLANHTHTEQGDGAPTSPPN